MVGWRGEGGRSIIIIIVIIINLFIVGNKNTIKNIFLSTNVASKTWLILVNF